MGLSKIKVVRDWFFNSNRSDHKLYVWRPGSDDVKLIFAIDDESAARIAVKARIDHNEMTEKEALEHVLIHDLIAEVDSTFMLFQGLAPLWDGTGHIGDCVGSKSS